MKRGIVGALAAVTAVTLAAWILFHRGEDEAAGAPALQPAVVAAAVARSETWQRQLPAVGTLAAYRGVEVTSSRASVTTRLLRPALERRLSASSP